MTIERDAGARRSAAVAGVFYPANPARLQDLVRGQLEGAARRAAAAPASSGRLGAPVGILVPHAGLSYSGGVAAAAWRLLDRLPGSGGPPTIVVLGTNHRAAWLDGIAAWERGAWEAGSCTVAIDDELAATVVALGPPFLVDRDAHDGEHSIEVQLPFLAAVVPAARIVPLAVSVGTGPAAIEAGTRLGIAIATRRAAGSRIVLAISSDMAHYPSGVDAEAVTSILRPAITSLDPGGLAARESSVRERAAMGRGPRGLACGMCGVEPAVVGLAALRSLGATRGTVLATATSADVGGSPDRAVGYLAARFD